MTVAVKHPETLLIVIDEITGRRTERVLPESPDEVLENSVEVIRAVKFAQELDCLEKYGPLDADGPAEEPLGVSVRKSADTIIVRWWAAQDAGAALERLRQIQARRAKA